MKIKTLLASAIVAGLTSCATTAPTPNQVSIRKETHFTVQALRLKDVDVAPKLELHIPPVYPKAFRASGVRGVATLEFIVDEQGRPTEVQISTASDEAFGEAAIEAVSSWHFSPARKNGRPVACQVSQQIDFKSE